MAIASALAIFDLDAVATETRPALFEASFLGTELAGMDMSRFAHNAALPAGDYDLDIFVNKESRGRRQVRVVTSGEQRTAPCLTSAMLRDWNIRLPDQPSSDPGACVDLAVAVPPASVVLKLRRSSWFCLCRTPPSFPHHEGLSIRPNGTWASPPRRWTTR